MNKHNGKASRCRLLMLSLRLSDDGVQAAVRDVPQDVRLQGSCRERVVTDVDPVPNLSG